MSDDLSELFESPRALLTWAHEDFNRFKELEDAFFDTDPYEQVIEFDPESGRDAHRIRFVREVPQEMRKLASHIINDLRHALDQGHHVASKFFGWRPDKKTRVLYFPWANSAADLKGLLERRRIPVEIHDILFDAEPYPAQGDGTGDTHMRQLGKIAGPNKHEAALSSCAVAKMLKLNVTWEGDWIVPYESDMWNDAKQELTLGYFTPGTQGDYDADIVCRIIFRDIPELANTATSDLFVYWATYVTHYVKRFEARVIEAGG